MGNTNVCRRSTISVVELQGVSQGNSDSGREQLRLPTASLTIIFSSSIREWVVLEHIIDTKTRPVHVLNSLVYRFN